MRNHISNIYLLMKITKNGDQFKSEIWKLNLFLSQFFHFSDICWSLRTDFITMFPNYWHKRDTVRFRVTACLFKWRKTKHSVTSVKHFKILNNLIWLKLLIEVFFAILNNQNAHKDSFLVRTLGILIHPV